MITANHGRVKMEGIAEILKQDTHAAAGMDTLGGTVRVNIIAIMYSKI